MEFQKTSSAQNLDLKGIIQGRRIMIAITGATENCELYFKHAGDDWRKDTRFTGTHTGGTIIVEIIPVSAELQLRFVGVPSAPYFVSVSHVSMLDG